MRGIPRPPNSTDVADAPKVSLEKPVNEKMRIINIDNTFIPSKIVNFINKDMDKCNVFKIDVNVNKMKIVNSIIDSGSVYSLISDKLATELKLTTVPSNICLLYTSPSPRDKRQSRMPSSA